ncbi:MAG: phage terminase large subunit [Mucinivorans sp.]
MIKKQKLRIKKTALECEIARRDIESFAIATQKDIEMTTFHQKYYQILSDFAHSKIDKLMVSVPPQHGKSHGASLLLPAYLLGIDPQLRICIGSYSFALARRFGLGVQRLIESSRYQQIFPGTKLKGMGSQGAAPAQRTADEFDIVGHSGGLRLVGREGSLTGNRVDVMIVDDLYKDAMEAASPLVRENTWQWYCAVVRTRMHNKSREIVVSTRWHEDDLMGKILKTEPKRWRVVNFPAIKIGEPSVDDPRNPGQALWPDRHSVELLDERRRLDPELFEALYQGNPSSVEGLLYSSFATYKVIEEPIARRAAYVDTADTGSDFLCAVCYAVGAMSGKIYVQDVVYSDLAMEETESLVAGALTLADSQVAYVESNNGGRGFARSIARTVHCRIETFHQSQNKEARVISNATQVMRSVVMPHDWRERFPAFSQAVLGFRRTWRANAHDDAVDALTGVVEKEVDRAVKKITAISFS